MNPRLTGSWIAVRSTIPGYETGNEWLSFSEAGEHLWVVGQPARSPCPPVRTRLRLEEVGDAIRLRPFTRTSEPAPDGSCVGVEWSGADEIIVTPAHGFRTIFRREPTASFPAGDIRVVSPDA